MSDSQSEVSSRYEIIRRIAAGGMCEILLAKDTSVHGTSRKVVIKRLAANLAAQPDTARMFRHEALLLATSSHPGLPTVHACWNDGVTWNMAMEYVRGVPLASLQSVPLGQSLCIVWQLLDALAYVHSRKGTNGESMQIVHRDLTPSNVIVTTTGHIKLMDFGIATSVAWPDRTHGSMRGTAGYMAPEAVRGDPVVDHRADLFSVGVLLYEITTGVRLFDGNVVAAMNAVVDGEISPPSSYRVGYSPTLEAIVLRALEREVTTRFAHAAEMLAALEACAHTEGVTLSPARLAAWLARSDKTV